MSGGVQARPRGAAPFDSSGITRDERGVAHYDGLPDSLIAMLCTSVDRDPAAAALVEVGGERLTYGELWDRASRVAGGLVDEGIRAATGWRSCCRPGSTGSSASSASSWPARWWCR
ncbi:MAG TPA: hypothetical protein VGH99_16505 [Pseudonocardia sp.]